MAEINDQRPRLLVLASTYPRWVNDPEPGFVQELAKRLVDHFDVVVLGPHAPRALPRERMEGVEVVRYRYAPESLETLVNDGGIVTNLKRSKWKLFLVPGFVLAQLWAAWRLLHKERIEVIHAHWLIPQGLIAALLQLLPRRKVPYLVTSHGADLYALQGGLMKALKRFVLRRAEAVTVVSGAMREHLRAMGADVAKVSVLPMGVDLALRFSPDPAVHRSDREILFVGRLVEKKGLRHLLNAMPEVLRRIPGAHLTIAGFGPEEAALKAQAVALGLADAVRFLGAVPQAELPVLYRRAALFVAPFVRAQSGDEEGLGLVLVEAIGCGCPILAGRVPALAEVLGEGFADLAVDPQNIGRLADAMVAALADPESMRARAAELRNAVGVRFDWKCVAERYRRLLGPCSARVKGWG
jgi:glycosyltransferase involved in cell wall biosynthesis